MAREFFCAYHSFLEGLASLNDAEVGRLFRGALMYSASGCDPKLCGRESIIWPMIKSQIDRDASKYAAYCNKQSENIRKRWDTSVYDGIPTNTKHTKEKKKEKKKKKDKENITPLTPQWWGVDVDPDLLDALKSFEQMRNKIKKPLTERGGKMILTKLEKLAPGDIATQRKILAQSELKCWLDVFPLKEEKAQDTRNQFLQYLQEGNYDE